MRMTYSMIFVAALLSFVGCNSSTSEPPEASDAGVDQHAGHDHSGWWCPEHGVPEEECPLCDTSLVAEFKAKGDWCDEHNRPESQCFVCDPDRFHKFAARYEAKYGEAPPQPTE